MADNVTIPATGTGTATPVVATDDDGTAHHQWVKLEWGPADTFNKVDTASGKPLPVQLRGSAGGDVVKLEDDASANADPGVPLLAVRKATPADTSGADGDYEFLQIKSGRLWGSVLIDTALPAGTAVIGQTYGAQVTVSTDITRPADTTAYAANDNLSDSTSAPTSGGFTLTNAARVSGGSGIITDLIIVSSNDPATTLQGEVWIYSQAATADNDNAAFTSSDSDTKNLVAVVPFTLSSTAGGSGTTSYAHVQNLSIGFTCSGTANLRYKVKVKAAYTPANAEVITVAAKIVQTN